MPNSEDGIKEIQLELSSASLTVQQVRELEKKLEAAPNDFHLRLQLMCFYRLARLQDSENSENEKIYQEHMLWMIINKFDSSNIVMGSLFSLTPNIDKQFDEKAKNLWLQQIEKHKSNPVVYKNAAKALIHYDKKIVIDLLKKGQTIAPTDPKWEALLSNVYKLDHIRKRIITEK